MPRPPRLHVPGACYHVILRGNHREPLFGSVTDRYVLNGIVASVLPRFDCRIHAFCWMTNHLHALIQIADTPLGAVMQRVAVRYSRYRHGVLHTVGHLFERRYRAKVVDVDAYFLTLLRYIHFNPVKARLVQDPAEFPWSSHRAYLGLQSIPWLTTDFGLAMLSSHPARARGAYRRFMRAASDEDDRDLADACDAGDSRFLATPEFVKSVRPPSVSPRSGLTLDELAQALCGDYGITVDRLRSLSRARALTPARAALADQAVEQRIATLSEVARFLHRDPSALTKLLARRAKSRAAR